MTVGQARRLRRLAEELEESGLPLGGDDRLRDMVIEEVDLALRPPVHERRIPSTGTIVDPAADPDRWTEGTGLEIARKPIPTEAVDASRRFVDGLSSWLVRRGDGGAEWLLFDRPAGSERDLVVLAEVLGGLVVQRHPIGAVRLVGSFGVLRWEGLAWHHEPPVTTWLDAVVSDSFTGDAAVLEAMLRMAVHDLGSLGIGALLVYQPEGDPPRLEERLPVPPPLRVVLPVHLAPLRHALAQVDGAALFDIGGVLRHLGVRLVPSREAEREVAALGGTRHTSGLRYSYDDPSAVVIVVSDDGPVAVLRHGAVVRRSMA